MDSHKSPRNPISVLLSDSEEGVLGHFGPFILLKCQCHLFYQPRLFFSLSYFLKYINMNLSFSVSENVPRYLPEAVSLQPE